MLEEADELGLGVDILNELQKPRQGDKRIRIE